MRIDDWHDLVFGIALCFGGGAILANALTVPFTLFPAIGFSVLGIAFALGLAGVSIVFFGLIMIINGIEFDENPVNR